MAGSFVLDHIALGADHAWENFNRYRGDLGGEFHGGMVNPGFYWGQLKFANGMIVEMLEPVDTHLDDFLERFLARSGPGPHHLTFKVPDIVVAIDACAAAGFAPVRTDLSQDFWKEAFLHPKQCHGIVVQLAQASAHPDDIDAEALAHALVPSRYGAAASLERIVHLVADLDATLLLYRDVLRGEVVRDHTVVGLGREVAMRWPGAGRIDFVQPTDDERLAWLGDRAGRVHYLDFTWEYAHRLAEGVPGAVTDVDGAVWIDSALNQGVRLRLRSSV